jgi:hypothetical protein
MSEMTGGCLCGKVRYSISAKPALVAVCHCKNCQKQAGTAFSVVIGIPTSGLSLQGSLKTYRDTGDSGLPVLRNFCPECGSPITSEVTARPDTIFVKAGTLDDTSWLDPKLHVYCDSAQSWTAFPAESHKFGKMPG